MITLIFVRMVRLYDYYGMEVYFKNKAELPISVFGRRADKESGMVLHFNKGLVDSIQFIAMENDLDHEDKETFRLIIEQNISEIIKSWLDAFLYKKEIEMEIIKTRISSN